MLDVLVVDDSPADRELIRRSLEGVTLTGGMTASVREAASGSEAIGACQVGEPDCLILDYRLPDGLGLEILGKLKGFGGKIRPPIIVITGNGSEAIAADTVRLGASDYLTKDKLSTASIRRSVGAAMERFRIEQQLHRYHVALERSNADLAQFAARLSHDLRGSINYVKGYSQMLQCMPDLDPAKKASYIDNIVEGIDRMDRMIQGLFQFSMVDQNRAFSAAVPLTDVFEETRKLMAGQLVVAGATLSLPDTAPSVIGDRGLLLLLMQNLVSNALKYRGEQKPRIAVRVAENGDEVLISVADNGRGIPADQRVRIFEMFHRVDQNSDIEGSGIGLATCRRIAERHDGSIWCESNAGGGTVFHISLVPKR